MTARSDKARRTDPPNVTTSNDTTELSECSLVELLVHSDPGPMVHECLGLAQILALSRACKSLHKLMLDETTRARNFWADAKAEASNVDSAYALLIFTETAANDGYLLMLAYLHENGYSWDGGTCKKAAANGHLDCLQYAHENGCPWGYWTCEKAAENGHLDCLKYAHENGCPWDEDTCRSAARKGKLVCLQYAHESGCPWDKRTCRYAAKHGHLDCLQYLHENGCEWDDDTCEEAALNGHLACLQYALDNNCPGSNGWTCWIAAISRRGRRPQ